MATYDGFVVTAPSIYFGGRSTPPKNGVLHDPSSGGTTEYQYRVLATGATGSTTDPDSIPAGSVVIGIVTS